jgi:short-subunit dehydrogenase
MKKVLILGANSAIAQHVARQLAAKGASLFLVGRNATQLEAVRQDVAARGAAKVESLALDLNDFTQHEALVDKAYAALGGLDGAVVAHGILGDQSECQKSFASAEKVITTNFTSAASLLTVLANRFEAQKSGTLVAISSVAGDRGRQSNYVYGASKAALNAFMQGLRNRLFRSGVKVVTVKPGFVDTPMTAHLKKTPMFAKPEDVARGILRAAQRGKGEVYLPARWGLIMLIIKSIPETVFKRLKL